MPTTPQNRLRARPKGAAARSTLPLVHQETDPRALTLFALAGLAVALFYGVVFSVWDAVAYEGIGLLAGACALVAAGALASARGKHRTAAGLVIVTVAGLALLPATATLSTKSDVHLLYLAVALAMLALFPERMELLRIIYGAVLVATVIGVEFVFPTSPSWEALEPQVAEVIAASNRIWTVLVSACGMVVILVRSARLQHVLFGAATTEERRANSEERRANTDVLTSLANRRPVIARFRELDARPDAQYALVLIDVDAFKDINDSFGHDTGDKVIVELAARLREHFGPDALVSRWGGDEFLAVVDGEASVGTVVALERFRKTQARFPVRVAGESLHVTLSIGAARRMPGATADDTLRAADSALYAAKEQGRNQVVMAADRVGGTA
jgi:diguanylate cyclase (GGDEF)-like protein